MECGIRQLEEGSIEHFPLKEHARQLFPVTQFGSISSLRKD